MTRFTRSDETIRRIALQDIVDYAEKAARFIDGKNAIQLAADEAVYLAAI